MKKNQRAAVLIVLILSLVFASGCKEGANMPWSKYSDEELADITFNKIIDAVKTTDASKLVDIFSPTVQTTDTLSPNAVRFIEFIRGEVVSFSVASESGVGTDYKIENGKNIKETQSAFCITTTENVYYVAVRECIKDDFDSNNIGVLSIYIIDAEDWTADYIFRGDGKWTCGINIMETPRE